MFGGLNLSPPSAASAAWGDVQRNYQSHALRQFSYMLDHSYVHGALTVSHQVEAVYASQDYVVFADWAGPASGILYYLVSTELIVTQIIAPGATVGDLGGRSQLHGRGDVFR
jgi:hypothetical protein